MRLSFIALAAVLIVAPAVAQETPPAATATFIDSAGAEIGKVQLTPMDGGVHIAGTVSGLPEGTHGIHIHETGTCDPGVMFESAGAHLNPADKQHGLDNPEGAHAGDLLNIEADADGNAAVDLHTDLVTLDQGPNGVFDADGSALVIHADADDQVTDPSGNSGDRIACAVIEGTDNG